MIYRYLKPIIERDIPSGKVIIIYGPRQVGKTTLIKQFITGNTGYFNCDQENIREAIETTNLQSIRAQIEDYPRIVIDEAQRVHNIGLTLKIMHDNFPGKQIMVTGSSSFDLSEKVAEPMTGRYFSHVLYPISLDELKETMTPIEFFGAIPDRLIYGSYPEIITTASASRRQELLYRLTDSCLLRDLFAVANIRQPQVVRKLLKAIAFQVGNEASAAELARLVGIDSNTVKRYLYLFEQAFILFSLGPYARNRRAAIARHRKYYFYDLGIRNALIDNFQPLSERNDVGALWENFCILERMKRNDNVRRWPLYSFWRSYAGSEIDLLEEKNGELMGFEMKYAKDKASLGAKRAFAEFAGAKDLLVVNKDNLFETLLT